MLKEYQISSPALRGSRRVWVDRSAIADARQLCVFLDAELYLERVGAAAIMESLGLPIDCVYISYGEAADRHADFTCDPGFTAFLVEELMPWIEGLLGVYKEKYLCGLSLSGLAAAFVGCTYPSQFKGVLCQSPSAWWNDEWLANNLPAVGPDSPKFWLSVGTEEIQEGVTHEPSGMFQGTTQLASCRRLAEALRNSGRTVNLNEFTGGHDPKCWAEELPMGMPWLLNSGIEAHQ